MPAGSPAWPMAHPDRRRSPGFSPGRDRRPRSHGASASGSRRRAAARGVHGLPTAPERSARRVAAMNLPDLLVPHELSDEAAAHVSELLNDLAPSPSTASTSRRSGATTPNSANVATSNARATTGNSTSSKATTCRSESPAAPTSAEHPCARSPTTGALANSSSPRPPRRRGARALNPCCGSNVKNRAPVDQE